MHCDESSEATTRNLQRRSEEAPASRRGEVAVHGTIEARLYSYKRLAARGQRMAAESWLQILIITCHYC